MKESKHIGKVSISVVCVILGILLALQFKSVRENNQIDALNTTVCRRCRICWMKRGNRTTGFQSR